MEETVARALAFINPSVSSKNIGDLFINDSAKRILVFDPDRSCDIDPRKPVTQNEIDRINRCDAAVIVGTCLWYRGMPKTSRWNFSLEQLKRIKVPVIPFGVGAYRHFDEDNSFEAETLAQIRQIHSTCAVSSARDLHTVQVLHQAGIKNVMMTACPTLFRHLQPRWELRRPKDNKQIVVTVRRSQSANVRVLIRILRERGLEPIVAGQGDGDRFHSYWLPFIQQSVPTLCEYNPQPYFELVEKSIGAIGWRLHGNMIHLACGRPAMLFSNCSRGYSFCESFDLPTVRSPDKHRLPDEEIAKMADRFFDDSTFKAFPNFFAEYHSNMAEFLNANSLQHRLGR